MLATFIKYASIDSQSDDETPWPCTAGQLEMAQAIAADVKQAIDKSCVREASVEVSADGYVYVRIPSNIKSECPSLGISCHLDVTPEAKGGNIKPIVDLLNGHTVVRTDGSTLLGADDKCGVTIAVELIRTVLLTPTIKHGNLFFVFCPNEDVGRAADKIDATAFCPDILFDLDGEEFGVITKSNFTARRFDVKFIGHDAHPGDAKAQNMAMPSLPQLLMFPISRWSAVLKFGGKARLYPSMEFCKRRSGCHGKFARAIFRQIRGRTI